MSNRVVIVGAGHAAGSVAALLRQYGWEGEIVLIGEEAVAPYQRPPLSKAYLKDDADLDSLMLRPDSFYAEQSISLHLGTRVLAVDPAARTVAFEGGGHLGYDALILATGSRARKLPVPGADLKGLHELRSIQDAEGLRTALAPGRQLAIVGAGYVGLEVAASARAHGAEVVVIERESRVLARVAAEPLSHFFEAWHRARGVEILTDAAVAAFEGDADGFVCGVRLADGRLIACDAALVGIGAIANDELARAAGLACDDGVIVDLTACTSDPSIHAIGDVTRRPMPLYGNRMHRLESVPNALEQAKQAACALTGRPAPAPEVPWFWSDQYDLKLQIAGIAFDSDRLVVRGDMQAGRFSLCHLKGDRLVCVEACNAPADFMAGKLLIGRGARVDPDRLADAALPLKTLEVPSA
ncbi:FAD-dependent oxidoreductase [Rhizobium sp. CRIBSB]|nr:FAD-dependent oxidoreductase [Rhizobium sp. CRIBSB]